MKTVSSLVFLFCVACGSAPQPEAPASSGGGAALAPAPCTPRNTASAPTYTELFDQFFAPGTPGHCATAHCHANPGFNVWLCGDTKDSCYAGMVKVGLVKPDDPMASPIGDPTHSPLSWINPTGDMPFDAVGPLPSGRDAIVAWLAACAPND